MSYREQSPWLIGLIGLAIFAFCVLLEHLLEPFLDPMSHQVSEYARTSSGNVMTVGFLAWALSLSATSLCTWRRWRSGPLTICLCLAALGIVVTACFFTQTSAGELPPGESLSASGKMHDLGSGLAALALLAGAAVSTATGRAPRGFRLRAGVLICLAVLACLVLLAIGPEVGGLRQRLTIALACVWQLALLRALAHPTEASAIATPWR